MGTGATITAVVLVAQSIDPEQEAPLLPAVYKLAIGFRV